MVNHAPKINSWKDERDPAKAAELLREFIGFHNERYYVDSAPLITDFEFDAALRDLQAIEKAHPELISADSPTMKVGSDLRKGFETFAHKLPMMSIDNGYNREDIESFLGRVYKELGTKDVTFTCEPKIDGVAISLWYENGELVRAVTRGDGTVGDVVTAGIREIGPIPHALKKPQGAQLPKVLEVRGEIYFPLPSFRRVNARREEEGLQPFMNPRNACSGTLKTLDVSVVRERELGAIIHGVGVTEGFTASDFSLALELFARMGLPITKEIDKRKTLDEIWDYIESFDKKREKLEYETDGVVIKVDSLKQRDTLGMRSKSPRSMMAFKYPPPEVETVLLDIEIQVGRTGRLTPRAVFEPVIVSGTKVTHASLHNKDYIEEKDIRVNDHVLIAKAGEIIPQVIRSLPEKRTGEERVFKYPETCPSCGGPAVKDAGELVAIRCVNPKCPAIVREKIIHFVSRDAMDISGAGEKLVDALVESGLVTEVCDLYDLTEEQVAELPRMGAKSAKNLIDGIAASRKKSLAELLVALGIPYVGEKAAEIIEAQYEDIDKIRAATADEIAEIEQMGPIIAESVHKFFADDGNWALVEKLRARGVSVTRSAEKYATVAVEGVAGKSFVLTGTLANRGRKEMEDLIKKAGGKCSSSVSKKTDYVIAGENAGSKLEKAEKLGVQVLTEEQAVAMLGITGVP
ncbi:MAG: NAD-dependent DNA ligase LigA [Planctomycetes bacterium]|nr:NAD-dependent DNA ligase LigA [Planctomycetota bacterium]